MTLRRSIGFFLCWLVANIGLAAGPEPILLWPNGAPGAKGSGEEDRPSLRTYLPSADKATGAGVVICPGGGYRVLASDHEGQQVAQWLNSIGVAGFVLKYRLGPRYGHPAPLQDAQRAIRFVRTNATDLGIDPDRLGIMGFSAGGHLASTAATHFDQGAAAHEDIVSRASCRPDFVILGYPVITLGDEFTHRGSRTNLLGEEPSDELVEKLSNERQVTAETPPAFLFHTGEDKAVPVQNSLAFYGACVRAGVPAELHIYQNGPHGVGLAAGDPVASSWSRRLADWLRTSGFLAAVDRTAVTGTVQFGGKPLRWGMITFVPTDPNAPTTFAMISSGRYSVPVGRGVAVGPCRIEVRDLGSVEPNPTVKTVQRLDQGALVRNIESDTNVIDLEFD